MRFGPPQACVESPVQAIVQPEDAVEAESVLPQ